MFKGLFDQHVLPGLFSSDSPWSPFLHFRRHLFLDISDGENKIVLDKVGPHFTL